MRIYRISSGCSIVKGKPVEKQGRKVSGLKGKTYDSGAAKVRFYFWLLFWLSKRRVACY
jgi:hypothetical protein